MATPLTLDTNILTTAVSVDPNDFVKVIYSKGTPAIPHDEVVQIGVSIDKYSRVFSMDGRAISGQLMEETNYLRFTGDVRPDQHNYGGIGTTGGGVQGEFFGSADLGVLALFAHNNIYWRGRKENWNPDLQQYWNASHRYNIVVAAGKAGVIKRIGDYGNGNWAMAGDTYPREIVSRGNLLGGTSATSVILKLAIGSGHHNTSGGNAREIAMTGPLTKMYVDTARAWGVDVRCYIPNDGLGQFPGNLSQAAHQVVDWANQGWVADYFLETHFQGLSGNNDAGRGFFCIYPDWDTDVDVDVRDKFAPIWAPEFSARTGLPLYGNGTMSEKRTGVGIDGYRLGIFGTTASIKASTTRLIIEHGCHTCPSDYALMQVADFNKHCAEAFMTALFKLHGLPLPGDGGSIPVPNPDYVPSGAGFSVNNQYLIGPFAATWKEMGRTAIPVLGLPISGMFIGPVEGIMRYVYITERGALACYPMGKPDGVAQDSEWFIRGLTPTEREEVLLYAKAQNPPLVGADVK